MSIDIKDFRRYTEEKLAKSGVTEANERAVEYLRAAAVDADKLAGNEQWDRFLRMVQPSLDDANKQYESARDNLPLLMDEKQYQAAIRQYFFNLGRKKAYEEVMTLPKQIMDYYNEVTGKETTQ